MGAACSRNSGSRSEAAQLAPPEEVPAPQAFAFHAAAQARRPPCDSLLALCLRTVAAGELHHLREAERLPQVRAWPTAARHTRAPCPRATTHCRR